jgi:ribosomal protein S27E
MGEGKVILFERREGSADNPVKTDSAVLKISKRSVAKREQKYECKHFHVLLDNETQLVTCNDCGLIMSAYSYLHARATEEERLERYEDKLRKSVHEFTVATCPECKHKFRHYPPKIY